ncbi:dynamin family protein [Aggregatilineales bacterium SYSU G02658]
MTMALLSNVLEGEIAALRQNQIELIGDIARSITDHDEASRMDRQRLLDIAQDLREMFFMVAVVGEFNSGKSSFVNALLGYNLLETGITPTTEFIELVRYSETPLTVPAMRQDGLREWAHPNTGAPGVAIVDTPGTGSIFMKHEQTAKNFLHRSDLVLFVFSAKQAFAESERLYLELARNYEKKIVLIINQIDLLTPAEQEQVRSFVQVRVKESLGIEPQIFMVSAKQALETGGEGGGLEGVRAYLRGVYAQARPAKQKLLNELDTTERILKKYVEKAQEKTLLVSGNKDKVKGVESELEAQAAGIASGRTRTLEEIDRTLEGVRERGLAFIDRHFTVRTMLSRAKRDELEAEFREVVIGRSMRDLNESATSYVTTIVDNSRMYWKGVIDRLNRLQEYLEQRMGTMDAAIYAEQRENLEEAIRAAEQELQANTSGKVLDDLQSQFNTISRSMMVNGAATAGGILAMAVAVATPGGLAAFPLVMPALIAGGVVTIVFGIPTILKAREANRRLREDLNRRIDNMKKTYHTAVDEITTKEINRMRQFSVSQLTPIYNQLETLIKECRDSEQNLLAYERQLQALRKRIEAVE